MADERPYPTIRDVARRAGVSTATVSRVISGAATARPRTRARVVAAAEELGYRPSAIARSLKLRTTRTIGLLVTDIENPYFPEIVRAVEDAALEWGHMVLLCNGADDPAREAAYLELLAEGRADGIIVASSGLQERHADWLARAALPVVLVNCTAGGSHHPAILSDNRAGGRIAAEHVLALGHRRMAFLSAPWRNAAAAERLEGVRGALAKAGVLDGLIVAEGDARTGGGERAATEVLERAPNVTAFLCHNDLTAIGAVRALRRVGWRVPEDMSVVGFDDVALASLVEPPLTTIAQDKDTMGRWAVKRLLELIARRTARPARAGSTANGSVRPDVAAPADSTEQATAPGSAGPVLEPVLLPVELRVRGSSGPAPDRPAGVPDA
jgi:LacI family transcriptional regulator